MAEPSGAAAGHRTDAHNQSTASLLHPLPIRWHKVVKKSPYNTRRFEKQGPTLSCQVRWVRGPELSPPPVPACPPQAQYPVPEQP